MNIPEDGVFEIPDPDEGLAYREHVCNPRVVAFRACEAIEYALREIGEHPDCIDDEFASILKAA